MRRESDRLPKRLTVDPLQRSQRPSGNVTASDDAPPVNSAVAGISSKAPATQPASDFRTLAPTAMWPVGYGYASSLFQRLRVRLRLGSVA